MKVTSATLCVIFVLALQMPAAFGQGNHMNAQNIGLGGGGTAHITGYNSVFTNPANLMLNDRSTQYSIGIGGFGTGAGGRLINMGIYEDYFTTGRVLDEATTQELTDAWLGSGSRAKGTLGFTMDVIPLGMSYRTTDQAFGMSVRSRLLNNFEMSKGMASLGLNGLNSNIFSDFVPVNSSTGMLSTIEVAFAYARKVWEGNLLDLSGNHTLYGGLTPVYVMGLGYTGISLNSQLRIREDMSDLTHVYNLQIKAVGELSDQLDRYVTDRASAERYSDVNLEDYLKSGFDDLGRVQAHGFHVNAGVTYEWDRGETNSSLFFGEGRDVLRLSLTLQDLGYLAFRNNARIFSSSGELHWEGIDMDFNRIEDEFDGDRDEYIEYVLTDSLLHEFYLNYTSTDSDGFSIRHRPNLTLAGAYTYGRMTAILDLGKGFNTRGMHDSSFFASVGAEYRLADVVPIRTGALISGYTTTMFSFGTGLNLRNFEFTLAAMATPYSGRRGNAVTAAWSGFNIRF